LHPMHYIFYQCLILVHFALDPTERKSNIQVEQIQSSVVVHKHQVVRILTLLWIKASPGAFNQCPLSFILKLYFMFYSIVQ
jgi:hypothetical protein